MLRPLEHLLGTLLAVAACSVAMSAEEGDNDKVIDNTAQLQIIEAVAKGFNDIYVFPEVAAKLFGETTRGAAHPSETYLLPEHNLWVSIPYGRAINPITGTNSEGTGVHPHVPVESVRALAVAHLEALQVLRAASGDDYHRTLLDWELESAEVECRPVTLSPARLREYASSYGVRRFTVVEDHLEYRKGDGKVYLLTPLGSDRFRLEGFPYLRWQFDRDETGSVIAAVGLTQSGATTRHRKDARP